MLSPRIGPESVGQLIPVGPVHSWRKEPVCIKLGYHNTTILLCRCAVKNNFRHRAYFHTAPGCYEGELVNQSVTESAFGELSSGVYC